MPAKADVDLDLSEIKASVALDLGDVSADIGLDDIQISVPKPVTIDFGLGDIRADAKVKADADVNAGINLGGELSTTSAVQAQADMGLKADLGARADLGVKGDLGVKADLGVRAHMALEEIRARLGADATVVAALRELAPVFLNLLWKEVPLVRVGMPHRYKLGLTLFGVEVAALSFCGESEIVTEDNRSGGGGGA